MFYKLKGVCVCGKAWVYVQLPAWSARSVTSPFPHPHQTPRVSMRHRRGVESESGLYPLEYYMHVRNNYIIIDKSITCSIIPGVLITSSLKGKMTSWSSLNCPKIRLDWFCPGSKEGFRKISLWLHQVSLGEPWCFHFCWVLFSKGSVAGLINAIKSMTFN